ncbi:UDP-N-acetylmuramate dehydrogenase [Candidatus Uhrbacteria bacterium]|nr:UDP-N-acetylmuramate dehydrogenase [Candidatus Uhrbacteria bacterium]
MNKLSEEAITSFLQIVPTAKRDELMSNHTSVKIGGPARLYVVAPSNAELLRIIGEAARLNIPFVVFGGGSNLLVADDGYEGVVIQAADRSMRIEGERVIAASGAPTGVVARAAAEAGLEGFEWGIGVPGTIGGATYGNAGCFGGEMKDVVSAVETYDPAHGSRRTFSNADCRFGYRDSRFKHDPYILLETTLLLRPGNRETALTRMTEVMEKRKASQPQGSFSAGCLFKNYEFQDGSALDILKRHGDGIPETFLTQKRIPAGWLIDRLGLKGTSIGQAQISPVHGNFFVNRGGARAQDVLALSSFVKMKVRDELGILLEDEVQLIGW